MSAGHHPRLVRRCERLYADGGCAPKRGRRRITRQVHGPAKEYGIGTGRAGTPRRIPQPVPAEEPTASGPTRLTLA